MDDVAVVRYEEGLGSLGKALGCIDGLRAVAGAARVVIKPNLVQWHEASDFPKYGVLTTARIIEDLVILLKDSGVRRISLAEGPASGSFRSIAAGMGLDLLASRYGVQLVDVFEAPFVEVRSGERTFSVSRPALEADHLIDLPALKTHCQTRVSLGIKNLKGLLDVASRKRFHAVGPGPGLDAHLACLAGALRPSLTILDGIYTLERGPLFAGDARRTDVIVASGDLVSADKVGAAILGIPPESVPHIELAAERAGRPPDLSDVRTVGDATLAEISRAHAWDFNWAESGKMPSGLAAEGVRGITWRKPDETLCTYCVFFLMDHLVPGLLLAANRGEPFDDIEILEGKARDPEGGHKHTMLLGQCQVHRNARNPLIRHCAAIGGCPPREEDFFRAFRELGIDLPADFEKLARRLPERVKSAKYGGRPEFREAFFRVGEAV